MPRPSILPADQLARVLAAADVSRKTLTRYLAGSSLHASSIRRITAALRAEDLERLVEQRAAKIRATSDGAAA